MNTVNTLINFREILEEGEKQERRKQKKKKRRAKKSPNNSEGSAQDYYSPKNSSGEENGDEFLSNTAKATNQNSNSSHSATLYKKSKELRNTQNPVKEFIEQVCTNDDGTFPTQKKKLFFKYLKIIIHFRFPKEENPGICAGICGATRRREQDTFGTTRISEYLSTWKVNALSHGTQTCGGKAEEGDLCFGTNQEHWSAKRQAFGDVEDFSFFS